MADTTKHRRLFLSAVSGDFREARELLKQDLSLLHVKVVEQADFADSGGKLIEKLDEYIRSCDAMIQLVGRQVGHTAKRAELDWLTGVYPDFVERFPFLAEQLAEDEPTLSYTQLEAWLGLYHGLRCHWYQPTATKPTSPGEPVTPHLEPGTPQFEHWSRLEELGEDRGTFDDPPHLCRRVLRALHDLWPKEVPAPKLRLIYPSLGAMFIGREPFLQGIWLRLQTARATGHWPNHAVHGLGGVGKTRLVVEYAWRYRDHYAAVLMVNAESRESLDRELATLAGVLTTGIDPHAPDPVRLQATRDWLQRHPGWLLLVDNVDSDEAWEAVAARLPEWSAGHVVITGRVSNWTRDVEPLDLRVLEDEDARRFLLAATEGRRLVKPDDEEQAWRLAVDDLGGLCLALEQASAYISALDISFAMYRQRWQKNEKQVRKWAKNVLMRYHPESPEAMSVATTWQTTVDQLEPAPRALLEMLSWLAPAPLPRGLLEHDEMQTQLRSLVGDDDTADVELALADLRRYSLVSRAADAEFDAAGQIHRLVQLITCDQLDAPARTSTLTAMLAAINDYTPEEAYDVRAWPVLEPLQPHLAVVIEHADRAGIAAPTARLLNQLALLLKTRANYAEAEPLYHRALAIGEQSYGAEHPRVAIYLNNLAQLLRATNRSLEAEPMMRRALAIDEQCYGVEHPNVARSLNNLAELLRTTNRLEEAEPMHRRALAIREASYREKHPDVAQSLNNLALLLNATNRSLEAEPLMRRALAIGEQSYGAEHPNVARGLNNLAELLRTTSRLEEAEPMHRRALAIREASYREKHPDVAQSLNNLGLLLQATNRSLEAEPLMRRAVEILRHFRDSTGHQHPNEELFEGNLERLIAEKNRQE